MKTRYRLCQAAALFASLLLVAALTPIGRAADMGDGGERPVDMPMPEPHGAHLTLVKDGMPQATIVVAKEALTAQPDPKPAEMGVDLAAPRKIAAAARDLQTYIEKITKAKLPIVGDDQAPQGGTLIFVGRSNATREWDAQIPRGRTPIAAEEGYVTIAKGKTLLLAGNDEGPYHGTEYAVDNFLYQQGVRWYMPGEFGEVIPHRGSIYAADTDRTSKPDFRMRGWWGTTSPESQQLEYRWRIRNGMTPLATYIPLPGDSSIRSVLPPADKVNDKAFAGIFGTGENGLPNPYMPDLSNPKSALYAANVVKDYFRKNPKVKVYGIAPDDGMPRDYSPNTLKMNLAFPDQVGRIGLPSEMSATEEWMHWIDEVNTEVKKDFPDHLISTNGYANRNTPPFGVTFDPNIPIMFAAIWCDNIHAFDNPRSWMKHHQALMLERWCQLSHNVFLYNYTYYMLASAGAPIPLSRLHEHDMPLYKKWGVIGFANEGRYVAGEQGIFPPYYQGRLMWDASLKRDDMAREYFANWYGPAAKPARAFWEDIEQTLEETPILGHEDRILPYVYSQELLDKLERHEKEAEKLATGDWFKTHVHADRLILEHFKGYMAMHKAEFEANFPEAVKQANYMLEQRKGLNAMSRSFFDIRADTGDSWGFYYWGVVQRRDYYQKMADLTTGKTGNMVKVLPEEAKFTFDVRDDGRLAGWFKPDFDDAKWHSIKTTAPFYLNDHFLDEQGYPTMGILWYRLNVEVPASAQGKKVMIYAPAVEDEAWVWVNGKFIGHREYHEAYERPNPIDMDVTAALKPGEKNSIVIRVNTALAPADQAAGMTSRLFLYAPK